MIKISTGAKVPLELSKGTYALRFSKAQKITDEFFNKISLQFTEKDIEPDVFTKTVEDVLPSKINFKIANSTKADCEGAVVHCLNPQNTGEMNSFKIFLPLNKYDNKISIDDTNVFMHEIFHFFCEIFNPKHIAKSVKLNLSTFRRYDDFFYNEYLYNKKCIDIDALKNNLLPEVLDNMPDGEKIIFLQNARYKLKEEVYAWGIGYKYGIENQKIHKDLICEKIEPSDGREFKLGEKLEIVNYFLKEILNNARKNK